MNKEISLSSKFTLTNFIIYFIFPVRILCDTLPLIPTLMNVLLLVILFYDSLFSSVLKKEVKCFLWILFGTCVGYVLACYYQHNYVYPIRGFIRYGTYFFIFLYFSNHKIKIKDLYNVYTVLAIVQVVLSPVQDFILHQRFCNGTLQNRNHECYFLAFYMCLSLFEFKKIYRSLFLFLFELYLGGLGGAVAATSLLFFYFVVEVSRKQRIQRLVLFSFVILLGVIILSDRIIEAIESFTVLPERIQTGQVGASSSIVWRIVTWFNMCKQMHIDAGVGIGAGIEYGSYSSPYLCSASIVDPHNDYVRVYIESGFLGVFIFITGIIYSSKQLKLKSKDKLNKTCFYFLLVLLMCMTIANLIVQPSLFWFYFAYLGQINAINKEKEKINEKNCISNTCQERS